MSKHKRKLDELKLLRPNLADGFVNYRELQSFLKRLSAQIPENEQPFDVNMFFSTLKSELENVEQEYLRELERLKGLSALVTNSLSVASAIAHNNQITADEKLKAINGMWLNCEDVKLSIAEFRNVIRTNFMAIYSLLKRYEKVVNDGRGEAQIDKIERSPLKTVNTEAKSLQMEVDFVFVELQVTEGTVRDSR